MAVRVTPYSEAWPAQFATVHQELEVVFAQHPTKIEHIGSTSVPGLCAKPIIDVLVGAESLSVIEAEIPKLAAAGYEYISKYEAELPMRRYFVRYESDSPRVNVLCMRSARARTSGMNTSLFAMHCEPADPSDMPTQN